MAQMQIILMDPAHALLHYITDEQKRKGSYSSAQRWQL